MASDMLIEKGGRDISGPIDFPLLTCIVCYFSEAHRFHGQGVLQEFCRSFSRPIGRLMIWRITKK